MTSSASNSLADKTYYYIRERVDNGHWAPGTWLVNRKQIVQLYALREQLECFAVRVMRRHMEEQP